MDRSVEVDFEGGEVSAIRMVRKSGSSFVVTIPPKLLDGSGLNSGDDVEITTKFGSRRIVISEPDDEGDEANEDEPADGGESET